MKYITFNIANFFQNFQYHCAFNNYIILFLGYCVKSLPFSFLDGGTWLIFYGGYIKHKNPSTFLLFTIIGYTFKLFCFGCVGWQSYVCLDKYYSKPISTGVSYVSNEGTYPLAITFCKMLFYSDITPEIRIEDIVIEDLFMIAGEYAGNQGWSPIYQNGKFLDSYALPKRRFTTFVWSNDTFRLCLSLQTENEKSKLNQVLIAYRRKITPKLPYNLQIFVHGVGSFSMVKYEIPLRDQNQVIQLNQETVESLSIPSMSCSAYENSMLDECLETKAVQYANTYLGYINNLLR